MYAPDTNLGVTVHFAVKKEKVKLALILEKGDPNKSASTYDLSACHSETKRSHDL